MYARGIYPVIYDRTGKFPGGESMNDLQERAERAVRDVVLPHVWNMARSGQDDRIALVSHGLCISELVAALVRRDSRALSDAHGKTWTGLQNTAWTRVGVNLMVRPDAF